MILDPLFNFISRLIRESGAFNTINATVVEVYFQRSPGWPSGDQRGIKGLEFQVVAGGVITQSGQTAEDGKIKLTIAGGQAEIQLLADGAVVASYQINVRSDPYEAGNTIIGVQRRLRGLGYQLEHGGTSSDGLTTDMTEAADRAILAFQVDESLTIDGQAGANTQTRLGQRVGGTAV